MVGHPRSEREPEVQRRTYRGSDGQGEGYNVSVVPGGWQDTPTTPDGRGSVFRPRPPDVRYRLRVEVGCGRSSLTTHLLSLKESYSLSGFTVFLVLTYSTDRRQEFLKVKLL